MSSRMNVYSIAITSRNRFHAAMLRFTAGGSNHAVFDAEDILFMPDYLNREFRAVTEEALAAIYGEDCRTQKVWWEL